MTATRPGRPLNPEINVALRQAAERVMRDSGFSSLTVDGLVTEIGTTRPAFYRRYQTLAHLALDVIRTRFGTGLVVDTGSLLDDLLVLQREEVAMFADPVIRNNLPGLFEAIRRDPELQALYLGEFIAPRRTHVTAVIAAAMERGELTTFPDDIGYVCDLLLGPILVRAVIPTPGQLNDDLARKTAATAFHALMS